MKRLFFRAVQFLTIVPMAMPAPIQGELANSAVYFPAAGVCIGVFSGAVAWVGAHMLGIHGIGLGAVIVVGLAGLNGGLHLDGVADTCDAFFSRKDKAGMLDIMRDPRLGAMGVIGIVSVMLMKTACIGSFHSGAMVRALIISCCVSRWAMVYSMCGFPYARVEGKAKEFIDGADINILAAATLMTGIFVFLAGGLQGLLVLAVVALCVKFLNRAFFRGIGGITGDTIGCINEVSEVVALAVLLVCFRMGAGV